MARGSVKKIVFLYRKFTVQLGAFYYPYSLFSSQSKKEEVNDQRNITNRTYEGDRSKEEFFIGFRSFWSGKNG